MPSPRHSAADVLAQALVDAGQLADPETLQDWTARVGSEPDTPDNVVTLYDTQSKETGRDHNTGRGFSLSGVQVRVRGQGPFQGPSGHHYCRRSGPGSRQSRSSKSSYSRGTFLRWRAAIRLARQLGNATLTRTPIDAAQISPVPKSSKKSGCRIRALVNADSRRQGRLRLLTAQRAIAVAVALQADARILAGDSATAPPANPVGWVRIGPARHARVRQRAVTGQAGVLAVAGGAATLATTRLFGVQVVGRAARC